jgi:membrane protease YdiL (CAAX protease family)
LRTASARTATRGVALAIGVLLPFVLKGLVLAAGLTGYVLQSLYKVAQVGVPWVWRFKVQGYRGAGAMWPVEQPRPGWRTLATATIVALITSGAAIGFILLFGPALGLDPVAVRAGLGRRFSVTPATAIGFVLFLAIVNSGLEELYFRYWMDREISRKYGTAVGVSVSALLFGLMHILIFYGQTSLTWTHMALLVVALVIAGVAWSLILRMRGGLYGAWWSHCLNNLVLMGWGLHWLGYV